MLRHPQRPLLVLINIESLSLLLHELLELSLQCAKQTSERAANGSDLCSI